MTGGARDGDRGGGGGLSRFSDEELHLVLDTISSAKDILSAAATCKRWERLAFQGPSLEFVGFRGNSPERALTRLVLKTSNLISLSAVFEAANGSEVLTFHDQKQSEHYLLMWLRHCPNLTRICFRGLEGFPRHQWLSHIGSHAPNLRVLSLTGLDFRLDSLDALTSLKSLEDLEVDCPRLKGDCVACLTSLSNLRKLTMTVDFMFSDTFSNHSLRFLCLKSDARFSQVYPSGFELKLDLPALETLKLHCVGVLLVSNSPLLTHMEVDCVQTDLFFGNPSRNLRFLALRLRSVYEDRRLQPEPLLLASANSIEELYLQGRNSISASSVLPSLKSLHIPLESYPFQVMRDFVMRAPRITSIEWFIDSRIYPDWYRKDGPSPVEIASGIGEIIKSCKTLKNVKVAFMDSSDSLFTVANCILKLQKAFPCLDFSVYRNHDADDSESDSDSGSDSEVGSDGISG